MLDARRHLFWDNIKDAESIMFRWEELRCYYERLLNQPEVLAWPTMYDELGLYARIKRVYM